MILMCGEKIEIGTVLEYTSDDKDPILDIMTGVVIDFNEKEDQWFSRIVLVSIEEMNKVVEYLRVRVPKKHYPFNSFKDIKYVDGSEFEDWEETTDPILKDKYKGLFKPMQMLEFDFPKKDFKTDFNNSIPNEDFMETCKKAGNLFNRCTDNSKEK